MSKGSFEIGGMSQDLEIDLGLLEGVYDGLRSYLRVFLSINLRFPKNFGKAALDFMNVQAGLLESSTGMTLSNVLAPMGEVIYDQENYRERKTGIWFVFQMDKEVVHSLQKIRNKADVNLKLDLVFSILRKEGTSFIDNEMIWSLEKTSFCRGSIWFTIPQSTWVNKILPGLGWPGFLLIEIPLKHRNLNEAYENIIFEFNKAELYFNQGEYNVCIAHCRNAMDSLTRNLTKLKNGTKSESAFKWLSKVDDSTLTWIDTINKTTSSIASKPHHSGMKTDFTRCEAESIYLVTLGLMNLIGQYQE
ncbi:MAG: hypothetical protein KDC93_08775 [Cyclobacteriaceae bacterium]|nr:hypothetical protein [Cyclobacteriaceae bacterium]